MTYYDPVDLALLVCGWTQGAAETGREKALSVTRVEELEDVARMLSRLYEEVQDEWTGEWAYEVAEPLGVWIGRAFGRDGDMPLLAEIEEAARAIVAKVMATQPQDAGVLDNRKPGEK